jgi:ribosome-binding factor A
MLVAADVKRAVRVAERVREELACMLTDEVRDPRVAGAIVSRVEMADDLRSARVFVRTLEGGASPERRRDLVAGLERATGMLRREVTQRLGLRWAPTLRFIYDEGQDKVARIEELLAEVEAEKRSR